MKSRKKIFCENSRAFQHVLLDHGFVQPPTFPGISVDQVLGSGLTSVVFQAKKDGKHFSIPTTISFFFFFFLFFFFFQCPFFLSARELTAERDILNLLADPSVRIPMVTSLANVNAILLSPLLRPIRTLTHQHAKDLFDAVIHVHFKNYVHRDIRRDNIMEDDQGHAYLIDFGHHSRCLERSCDRSHRWGKRSRSGPSLISDSQVPLGYSKMTSTCPSKI